MSGTFLPLYTPITPSIITKSLTPKSTTIFNTPPASTSFHSLTFTCKASISSRCSQMADYNLYDLLGVESSSNQSDIKSAYRALQKHCHPDIAGPAGHDMAIILNEAYSVLSDPSSRLAYDKEQSKIAEFRGYKGKPLYSVWLGPESEQRAVFVDEVKCVGCLKCALFAEKTFAIEAVYGRARVVAQWADPEHKIQAAIETCPVDCISVVERSDLAALEFLMSKQPRGNVRVGGGNSVGARVSNVFVDVKKFQTRVADAKDKAFTENYKGTDQHREAVMAAVQAIQAISNWLYWQPPNAASSKKLARKHMNQKQAQATEQHMNKLREVAAARKQGSKTTRSLNGKTSNYLHHDEYWMPSRLSLPASVNGISSTKEAVQPSQAKQAEPRDDQVNNVSGRNERNPLQWFIPMGTATAAAVTVHSQVGDGVVGDIKEHAYGSFALAVVNSSWLQVALAGVTWFLIGMILVELIEAIRSWGETRR